MKSWPEMPSPCHPSPPLEPEQLLSLARAHLPVPTADGRLFFASDLAGVTQTYRLDGPDRFPVRIAPSQDRVLPVGETPYGLLVRRDRGGNELWQLELLDGQGGLRQLGGDLKAIYRDPKVSPDGRRVGFAYNPGGQSEWVLAALDLETGEVEHWLDRATGAGWPGRRTERTPSSRMSRAPSEAAGTS